MKKFKQLFEKVVKEEKDKMDWKTYNYTKIKERKEAITKMENRLKTVDDISVAQTLRKKIQMAKDKIKAYENGHVSKV